MSPVIFLAILLMFGVVSGSIRGELPCLENGVWYNDSDIMPDRCNFCTCMNGAKICTRMACVDEIPPVERPCEVGGKMYPHGSEIPDPCNYCYCHKGDAACTLMACNHDSDGQQ